MKRIYQQFPFILIFPVVALVMIGTVALQTGCTTFYGVTVSLTQIVDSASKEYARAYNSGLVPETVARKASAAHAQYRLAAGALHDVLVAKKAGQTVDEKAAVELARGAAKNFVDVIAQLLTAKRAAEFQAQIAKAKAP